MWADRGAVQVPVVGENPRFLVRDSNGIPAFEVTLNAALYPAERQERILAFLVKHLLDPVDPPLRLLASDSERTPS